MSSKMKPLLLSAWRNDNEKCEPRHRLFRCGFQQWYRHERRIWRSSVTWRHVRLSGTRSKKDRQFRIPTETLRDSSDKVGAVQRKMTRLRVLARLRRPSLRNISSKIRKSAKNSLALAGTVREKWWGIDVHSHTEICVNKCLTKLWIRTRKLKRGTGIQEIRTNFL